MITHPLRALRPVLLGTILALGVLSPALADPPTDENAAPKTDPDLGSRIVNAVAFDGRLWVLGAARDEKHKLSALVSFSLPAGTRVLHFSDGVIAMEKSAGHLWVLRQVADDAGRYRIEEWRNGEFTEVTSFDIAKGDTLLALTTIHTNPAVISKQTVREFAGGDWHIMKLISKLDDSFEWGFASVGAPLTGDLLYVGLDRGEWGGGLRRVDLKSGEIDSVENLAKSAGGFGTVLSSGLDPVDGIVPDSENPNCIIGAIGLVHFMSSGRIVRVCDRDVSVVLDNVTPVNQNGRKFDVEEAFFGIVPTPQGYWAVSNRAVYHFEKSMKMARFEFPKIEPWNGLFLSRRIPGVIVLVTDMNRTFSLSGYTPLIVPLEAGN